MSGLNLNKFLTVFYEVWEKAVKDDKEAILSSYADNTKWTDFMLGNIGVISRVAESINKEKPIDEIPIHYVKEWYKVDALFVSGKDLFRSDLTYPSEVQAIIEHENGNDVEEEMWKLLHWRSPLKVLIFYDYIGTEKKTKDKEDWLDTKLDTLFNMYDDVSDFNVESTVTEYLFLVGSREDINSTPTWKWASTSQRRLRDLSSNGALDLARHIAAKHNYNEAAHEITITLESNQLFEESISLHGALHKSIDEIVDKINRLNKQGRISLKLNDISISNIKDDA